MMNRIVWVLLILIAQFIDSTAQNKNAVLSSDEVLFFVKNYHPVAMQAELLLQQGSSTVRQGRGAFDPILKGSFDEKTFDNQSYFRLLNGGLIVPTWYGIELKTGIEQNSGQYLNPENTMPSAGLWYGGISVPLGQGLFIDKRRAALKQAQLFASSTEAEQRKIMNELLFDAYRYYWKWVESYNHYLIHAESVDLAKLRFDAVKRNYELGEAPAIDTLEAMIQLQSRQMNLNQGYLDYRNSTLELSNFLWFENYTPLVISDSLRPPMYNEVALPGVIGTDSLDVILQEVAMNHPEMNLFEFKLASLEVERRLKSEALKPKLNLNYNALNERLGNSISNAPLNENYKWGLSFSFPLFLREERGQLQLAKIKLRDVEYDQQQRLRELQNKLRAGFNEQITLSEQVSLYSGAVNNYQQLLKGERQKFEAGESSLFLVNSREINLIQARLKLVELIAKLNVSRTGIYYISGNLYK